MFTKRKERNCHITGCPFDIIVCAPTEKRILKISWNPAEVNLLVTHLEGKLLTLSSQSSNSCFLMVLLIRRIKACLFFPRSDTDTVVGLPRPIHESIKTLKQVSRAASLIVPPFNEFLPCRD